jgi:hypothetical protein
VGVLGAFPRVALDTGRRHTGRFARWQERGHSLGGMP